jgi:hypothetical protein
VNTIWHNTIEGWQYFVRVVEGRGLELSGDPLNELCGGGWSRKLACPLESSAADVGELTELFGTATVVEMKALSRALQRVAPRDFEDRTRRFLTVYGEEMMR